LLSDFGHDSKHEKEYYKVLRAVIFAQHNARK